MSSKKASDSISIPKEFLSVHALCWELHNLLLETIRAIEEDNQIYKSNIKLSKKSSKDLASKSQSADFNIFDFLIENKRAKEVYGLQYQHIANATIADFLNFIHTSLVCAEKGKLVVSIHLLRKPVQENLLILEYILARPKDFLKEFNSVNGLKSIFDKGHSGRDILILSLINECLKKLNDPHIKYKAEELYDARFYKDKNLEKAKSRISSDGINALPTLFDWATHIYTGNKNISTSRQDLNLIFLQPDNSDYLYKSIYTTLPLFLYHVLRVYDKIWNIGDLDHDSYKKERTKIHKKMLSWIKKMEKSQSLWFNIKTT